MRNYMFYWIVGPIVLAIILGVIVWVQYTELSELKAHECPIVETYEDHVCNTHPLESNFKYILGEDDYHHGDSIVHREFEITLKPMSAWWYLYEEEGKKELLEESIYLLHDWTPDRHATLTFNKRCLIVAIDTTITTYKICEE